MTCTTLVVDVITWAATTIAFTHWAPPLCNGGCWPLQHQRTEHQWRRVTVELCTSLMRRRTSCLWWEGMVLPHPLVNVGHSINKQIRFICLPMNNTFSAWQVSDTIDIIYRTRDWKRITWAHSNWTFDCVHSSLRGNSDFTHLAQFKTGCSCSLAMLWMELLVFVDYLLFGQIYFVW